MTGVVNSTGARSGAVGTTVGTPSSNAADIGAGVLPVGVTGGSGLTALGTVTAGNLSNTAIVYPAGHITNVFRYSITSGSEYGVAGTGTKISQTPLSFSGINGRHYSVVSTISCWPYNDGTSTNNQVMEIKLRWGTTSRAQGDTTLDNALAVHRLGHYVSVDSTHGRNQYAPATVIGSFTAASTATHYVFFAQNGLGIASNVSRTLANATSPWNTTIYEIMP